jgi:hypothetical protein
VVLGGLYRAFPQHALSALDLCVRGVLSLPGILCPGKGRIKLKFSFISPFLPIPNLLHRKPVPGRLKRLPGAGFLPPFRGLFCVREAAFSENAAKLQKKLQFSHQKRRFPIDSLVIIGV